MKKPILFALAACMMLASCEKIVGDLDFLNHDMEVQGTINPTLGVPVARGSVSVYDLLQMVQVTEAKVEIGNDGIVNIIYDTAIKTTILTNEGSKAKRPSKNHWKSSNYTDTAHYNNFTGSVKIDMFDNIDSTLNGASIEIDNLYVNVGAFIKANANANTQTNMDSIFHVTVYYDSLFLAAVGKDGSIERVDLPNIIFIDSLLHGQYVKIFNKEDISHVINKRPVEIRYGARMNIAFQAEFYNNDPEGFVADSIGIDSVNINSDIKIEFPFSTNIKDLSYTTDLKFEPSFNLGDLTIDSSMFILYCDNGLPLALGLTAALIDSTGKELCKILDPTPTTLKGAPVGMDASGHFSSIGKSRTELKIPVTAEIFNNILKTKAIHLEAILNTTATGSTTNKNVAIKANDMLDILMTAKIKPSYPFTFGGNNDNNGQKGGLK